MYRLRFDGCVCNVLLDFVSIYYWVNCKIQRGDIRDLTMHWLWYGLTHIWYNMGDTARGYVRELHNCKLVGISVIGHTSAFTVKLGREKICRQ